MSTTETFDPALPFGAGVVVGMRLRHPAQEREALCGSKQNLVKGRESFCAKQSTGLFPPPLQHSQAECKNDLHRCDFAFFEFLSDQYENQRW